MQVRFQGMFFAQGRHRDKVQSKIEDATRHEKVVVTTIGPNALEDGFASYALTGPHAKEYLAEQGITVDDNADKAEINKTIGQGLQQKFGTGVDAGIELLRSIVFYTVSDATRRRQVQSIDADA